MKGAVEWLVSLFGKKDASSVARAYQDQIDIDTPNGKAIMTDLAWYCNDTHTTFVPGDPYQTALNEGRRDVYLHIKEVLGLSPSDFTPTIRKNNAQG